MPSPYDRQRPRRTRGLALDRRRELGDEAALADARGAEEREQLARSVSDRLGEGLLEPAELPLPADERARRAGGRGRRRRADGRSAGTPAPARPCPWRRSARPARPRRRRGRGCTSACRGGSRPGGAACSSRAAVLTVSPVTSVWPGRRVAGHDLAGVDPGPEADRQTPARGQLGVELGQRGRGSRPPPGPPGGRRPRGRPGCRRRP